MSCHNICVPRPHPPPAFPSSNACKLVVPGSGSHKVSSNHVVETNIDYANPLLLQWTWGGINRELIHGWLWSVIASFSSLVVILILFSSPVSLECYLSLSALSPHSICFRLNEFEWITSITLCAVVGVPRKPECAGRIPLKCREGNASGWWVNQSSKGQTGINVFCTITVNRLALTQRKIGIGP